MACQVVLGDHPSGKICHSTARISQITTRACSTGLNKKKGGRWSTERTSEKEDPSGQLDTPDKPNFLSPRAIFHFLIHPGRFKAIKPNNAQIRSDGQEQFRSVGRRQWCSTNIHRTPPPFLRFSIRKRQKSASILLSDSSESGDHHDRSKVLTDGSLTCPIQL